MEPELEDLLQQARAAARLHKDRTMSFGEQRRKIWAETLEHVRQLFPPALQQRISLEISEVALPNINACGYIALFPDVFIHFAVVNRGKIDYMVAEHRWELRPVDTFEVNSQTDVYVTSDLLLAIAKAEEFQRMGSLANRLVVRILAAPGNGKTSFSP